MPGLGKSQVAGRDSDPIVQMLAPAPPPGQFWIASQHTLLANGASILDREGAVGLILRRRGPGQTDAEWRMSLALATEIAADRNAALFCLSEDARDFMADITDAPVALLPAPPRRESPSLQAIWDPAEARIKIPELGTYLDDTLLSWARLRERLRMSVPESAPPDCADIAVFAARGNHCAPETCDPNDAILTLIPNGVGLGHLTRQLAVARQLRQLGHEVRFWCYSQAAGLIAKDGFEVIARQTADHLRMERAPWILREAEDLATFLHQSGTRTLIQDAGRISPAVAGALRRPGVGDVRVVLVRRGMWQPGKNRGWRDTEQLCDLVLEPSDLSGAADQGATLDAPPENRGYSRFEQVPPIVLTEPIDTLSRADARQEIGLDGRGPVCLVNLGGDALVSHTGPMLLIREAAAREGVQLVWLSSPLASANPHPTENDKTLRAFPAARLLPAFDGLITAAGYNSFHEALVLGQQPVLIVPTLHTRLDDQLRRAEFAREMGWAHILNSKAAEPDKKTLNAYFAAVKGGRPARRDLSFTNGAEKAASLISDLAARARGDGK